MTRRQFTYVRLVAAGLVLAFLAHPAAWGQEQAAKWFRRDNLGRLKSEMTFDTRVYSDQEVSRQSREMGWARYSLDAAIPVLQKAGEHDLSLLGRARGLDFNTTARLSDTGERFPEHLWDLSAGLAGRTKVDSGILGGTFTVGSPSDRPFASENEIVVRASGFYRWDRGEQNAWLFFVQYANDREFCRNVPLPGVAWLHEPSRDLRLTLGLPYSSFFWRTLERLELSASYMMIRTISAKAGYNLLDNLQFYVRYDWDSERFLRHDRRDQDDQLNVYEMRLSGGLRWNLTPDLYLDLSAGYAFQRFWFEAEEFDDRDQNRINLADGPFAALRVGLQF